MAEWQKIMLYRLKLSLNILYNHWIDTGPTNKRMIPTANHFLIILYYRSFKG